jgi:polyhydroxyalkanoate synthesis regulator phasin
MMELDGKPVDFGNFLNPRANKTIPPETNKHDRMKLLGRKILFYMGIPQNRITEEETIEHKGKRYRVDLIGSPAAGFGSDNFRIAVECGDNKAEKIEAMRSIFPLVLILPYKEFDVLEESEVMIIKKMLKTYDQQMIDHYLFLDKSREVWEEFKQFKQKLSDEIQKYKSASITVIDDDLKLSRTEVASIKEDISEFKQELRMLKDFKEFCKRFANGRHME